MTATTPPQEQEKRREEYRHRHIGIGIVKKRKYPWQVKLYLPKAWQPRFEKLEEILQREGSSISEWFRKQADPYIDLHEPGNPQQLLPNLLEGGKPYHALICQRHQQPAPYLIEFLAISGMTLRYCEDCFLEAKERGLVKHTRRKLL